MKMRLAMVGMGLVLLACGGGRTSRDEAADAGTSVDNTSVDGGVVDSGPSDAGVSNAGALGGAVQLLFAPEVDGGKYTVGMAFYSPPDDAPYLRAQPAPCVPVNLEEHSDFVSAGTVTISEGDSTLFTLPASDYDGYYLGPSPPTLTWNTGDVLTASATGAIFPAFQVSAVAPSALTGLTPDLSPDTTLTVPRTADLTLSWTPGKGQVVQIAFSQQRKAMVCGAADTGTFTVQASDLAQLDATQEAMLSVTRLQTTVVPLGNSVLYLQVGNVMGGPVRWAP